MGCTQFAYSQRFSAEYWHDATLILTDNTRLEGRIMYDFQKDLIQFESKNKTLTPYTAQNFIYFEINDAYQEKLRRFYSLPYDPNNGYRAYRIFEVLAEGRLNLLAREELAVNRPNYGYGMYSIPDQDDLVFSYYLLKEGGNIKLFRGKKPELLSYMGGHGKDVEKYMKQEHLKTGKIRDVRRIVSYYNSLFVDNR